MSRPYLRVHSDGQRYRIRWWCEDTGDWRMILLDFKYAFGQAERRFDPASRTWTLPLSCRSRVRQWADRWFSPDEREFTEDGPAGYRSGSRSYTESQSGYGRSGGSRSATAAVERAYAEMHLLPTAPPEVAQAAHKVMIRLTHPDAGGSHEAAVTVNLAWEVIEADQEQKRRSA